MSCLSNKILLCVSNTGGGHHSAALAVQHAIEEILSAGCEAVGTVPVEVVTADVVENSNVADDLMVVLYNYLLRHHQDWMKYYFNFIELARPDNTAIGYWLASGYLKKLLSSINPSIVVSLHPMANHYLAHALKSVKLPHQPKFIVIVTDPNSHLWTGWACADASITIVPNEPAKQCLISMGVKADRILTIGMPVDPQFLASGGT